MNGFRSFAQRWAFITPGRCVVCGEPVEVAKAVSDDCTYHSLMGEAGELHLRTGELAAVCDAGHSSDEVESAVVLTIPRW